MTTRSASLGLLTNVDGSSQFEWQDTKVVCSVTGPVEPKARQELATRLALEVIVRPARGVPNTREKLIEDRLRAVLTPLIVCEKYPRQLCQITCQILEAGEDESEFSVKELSCCVNASFLALLDAQVALRSFCASVPLAILRDCNELVVVPSAQQLQVSLSTHSVALELVAGAKTVQSVLLLDSNGDFTEDDLFRVLQLAEQNCLELAQFLRKTVAEKITNEVVRTEVVES
ncbi:hypothetical protein HG536_0G01620 [Torulaspora globosa]|uniref:Uncharacterized protein n=1 Tax=Torulaspora globosa TaxID=48254 RepID=A0A7G3ZLB7_9SACH|nr:uncharacterized protein HG536_0G01620 [Torulaspora globosa]QLL34303.1 hypothetical protein HG536_0G01620 [Torulaspora globosa]